MLGKRALADALGIAEVQFPADTRLAGDGQLPLRFHGQTHAFL